MSVQAGRVGRLVCSVAALVALTVGAQAVPVLAAAPGDVGTRRGRAAFCRALEKLEAEAREKGEEISTVGDDDPIAGILLAIGALGDFPRDLKRLAKKAPERMEEDLKAVADAVEESNESAADAISNPLGTLARLFLSSLLVSNSVRRIDDYARDSCGKTVFGT